MGLTFNAPIREDQLQASLKSAQDKHDRETLNAAVTLESSIRESVDTEIKADIQSLRTDLSNEVTLRASNENVIRQDYQSKINSEESARIQADVTLQNNIAAEKSARQSAITTLTDKINTDIVSLKSAVDSEISNRQTADNNLADSLHGFYDPKISSLSAAIANEVTLSASRDNELAKDFATNLTAEINARVTADNSLNSALDKEIANRQSDTAKLSSSITAETNSRQSDTAKLSSSITAETNARQSDTSTLRTAINNEKSARESDTARLAASITAEKSARESVDATIKADIQTLRTALTNEGTLRANNDATLKSALDTERTERIACDTAVVNSIHNYYDPIIDSLAADLANEITLSASRDNSALADSLAAETSARIATDTALQSAINTEKLARQSYTATLQSAIYTEKFSRQSDTAKLSASITAETNARQSDTATLRTLINNEVNVRQSDTSTLRTSINNEVNARQSDTAKLSASIESAVAGIKDYVPATDDTAGTHGFVPAPPVNAKKMILTHDGGWEEIAEAIPALSPRLLTKPTLKKADLVFNFKEQSPVLNDFDSDTMTIKGIDSAINVGTYNIIVVIKDKTRCCWDLETKDTEDVVLEWNIVKNNLIPKPTLQAVTEGSYTVEVDGVNYIAYTYDGTMKHCSVSFGGYQGWTYTTSVNSNYLAQTNAGTYTITYSLKDKIQTCWTDGTVDDVNLTYIIERAVLTAEQSTFTQTNTLTYSPGVTYTIFDAIPTLNSAYYVFSGPNVDGKTDAGRHVVYINPNDNYSFSDGSTYAKNAFYTIDKKSVPVPSLIADQFDGSDIKFVYDGTPKEVEIYGLDTDVAYIRSESVLTDTTVGSNYVKIDLLDKDNYIWENSNSSTRNLKWRIVKSSPTLEFSSYNIIFDGTTSETTLSFFTTSDGVLRQHTKGATDTVVCTINNETQTVTFTQGTKSGSTSPSFIIDSTNNCNQSPLVYIHVTNNPTNTLTAEQSTFTQEQTLIYNPNRTYNFYDAILNYNSNYLTATGDLTAKNAGTYTVLIAPKEGYTFNDGSTAPKTVTWKIDKATIDKPVAEGIFSFPYDGSSHSPVFSQQTSWDLLTKSGDVSKTNAGSYVIKFDITDKNNCCWTEDSGTATVSLSWEITKATLTAPTLSNTTHTYNGSTKSPDINNFDPDTMNKSGPESAINANTYTITFTVKNSNYQFPGGVSSVPRTWTINKATPTLSLSPNYAILDNNTSTATVTVTYPSDVKVTVINPDSDSVIAELNDNTLILTAAGYNVVTLTISIPADNNHNSVSRTFNVTSQYVKPFANCSWKEIQRIIKAGKAQTKWRVGDYKDFTMTFANNSYFTLSPANQTAFRVLILGFNHNSTYASGGYSDYVDFAVGLPQGTLSPIIDSLYDTETTKNTKRGFSLWQAGYPKTRFTECWLRTSILNGTFLSALPSDLSSAIVAVRRFTAGGSLKNDSTAQIDCGTDKISLLDGGEINLAADKSDYTQPYDFFKNSNRFSGSTKHWLRTHAAGEDGTFHYAQGSYFYGNNDWEAGDQSLGIIPIFRIG